MSSNATYYILNYVMKESERKNYIPAVFDGKNLLPDETLYNIFDGNCVTNDFSKRVDATGFIANTPTYASAEGNKIDIKAMWIPERNIFEWYDKVFENYYDVFEGTLRTDNTLYDPANDLIICIDVMDSDHIIFSFYNNVEKE